MRQCVLIIKYSSWGESFELLSIISKELAERDQIGPTRDQLCHTRDQIETTRDQLLNTQDITKIAPRNNIFLEAISMIIHQRAFRRASF